MTWNKTERPETGIKPRYVWLSERQAELMKAIRRYMYAGQIVPIIWVVEFNENLDQMSRISEVEYQ